MSPVDELASLVAGSVVGSSVVVVGLVVVGSSVVVDGGFVVLDGGLVVVDGGFVVVDGGFVVVDGLLVVVVVDGLVVLVGFLVGFLVVLLGSLLSEVTAGRVVVVTTVLPFESVVVVVTTTGGALVVVEEEAPFDGEPVGPVEGTSAIWPPSEVEEPSVEAGSWVPSASRTEALLVALPDGEPFSGPPVTAQAGTATTTAAATPPMMGRRSNRGRGARCLPTYLMARSRLPEPGSVRCLTCCDDIRRLAGGTRPVRYLKCPMLYIGLCLVRVTDRTLTGNSPARRS